MTATRAFHEGDIVLLIDGKDRRYLVTLKQGGSFHTHAGVVDHAAIMGREEGIVVQMTTGAKYRVLRPTLSEFVLKMPRGAQVIYPKDLGPLLMIADVFAGARILEAGVGSGALSMTLLRAGAEVIGYEIRPEFAERAVTNVRAFLGDDAASRYRVEERDVYEGILERELDRVILDLPEPWRVVKHAEEAMRPGGILVSYLPSIVQVSQLRDALSQSQFEMAETLEVLSRGWHVEGAAVRPNHRMVGHTGFLTSARYLPSAA